MTLQLTILVKMFLVIIMAFQPGSSHFTHTSDHHLSIRKPPRQIKNSPGEFGLVVMERSAAYQLVIK